jgi:hypothetical protein
MELNQDFREFFELLNKNEVRYLVVGGYALAFHGHPRYTKDEDAVEGQSDVDSPARLGNSVARTGQSQVSGMRPDLVHWKIDCRPSHPTEYARKDEGLAC